MDIARIQACIGLSQDKARALRSDWVSRVLAKHLPHVNNAVFLTQKFPETAMFDDEPS